MKTKIIFVLLCLFLLVSCGGNMADSGEHMDDTNGNSEYPQPPAEEPPSQSPYQQPEIPSE